MSGNNKRAILPPVPAIELKELNFLVGNWYSEGETKPTKSSPGMMIKGTDVYEWILEGHFLVHRVDVMTGNEDVRVIEVISDGPAKKVFITRSVDNKGTFTTMKGKVKDGKMKISGNKMRSTLIVTNNDHMNANWEISKNGKWKVWMDMKFSRAK